MYFDGDFSLLPLAADVRYGSVPSYPTSDQFQNAVSMVSDDLATVAAAHWYLEAVRERRLHPGRSLNDARVEINARVARRLFDLRGAA